MSYTLNINLTINKIYRKLGHILRKYYTHIPTPHQTGYAPHFG